MFDRKRAGGVGGWGLGTHGPRRSARRPAPEPLEGRQLLAATIGAPATLNVPATVGYQLPLQGGTTPQTYAVTSNNPLVQASVAQGKFWTVTVSHDSSGAGDPAFTGSMTFQLFQDLTPLTASKIEQLITEGFYTAPTSPSMAANGTTIPNTPLPHKNIHRVIPGFVFQGGSQTGTGSGPVTQAGFPFDDEYNPTLVYDGKYQLAMANAGNDTNDSQFFVTLGQPRNLDFNKTIFGQLVSGQAVADEIAAVKTTAGSNGGENSQPTSPIEITGSTLSDTDPNGVIHIDTTHATAGQAATLTITAADPTTGTTATRNVQVMVTPNVNASGAAINEQPFLLPVANQVVGQIDSTTTQNAVFQLGAYDTEKDPLTFIVGGAPPVGTAPSLPLPTVQNGTATVDANGIVTVTPAAGFTGTINLLVGVRDNVDHTGTGQLENIANYDTQRVSVTVVNGQPVNLAPIALNGTQSVVTNATATVQLNAQTANPQSTTQTLTYAIVTPPAHGTISNFNAATGTFTYTPNVGFQGTDALNFQVRDTGAPGPSLASGIATETLTVGGGHTGAVRLIGRVLVVTPPPRTDGGTNTIAVTQSNGNVQVTVNGTPDQTQPAQSALDRIVVYGSKAGDTITVAQDVTVPATLDGGQGGTNVIVAGGGQSLLHGWFGRTTLQGGPQDDTLIGRAGRVRFRKSIGNDVYYAGQIVKGSDLHGIDFPGIPLRASARKHKGQPPRGTFYRFVNDRLVPTRPPRFPVATQNTLNAPPASGRRPGTVTTS